MLTGPWKGRVEWVDDSNKISSNVFIDNIAQLSRKLKEVWSHCRCSPSSMRHGVLEMEIAASVLLRRRSWSESFGMDKKGI